MKPVIAGLTAVVFSLSAHAVSPQFEPHPGPSSTIVVVSAAEDPRLGLVDEAVFFWNKTLESIGSDLRLGPVTPIVRPLPETVLQSISRAIVDGPRWRANITQGIGNTPAGIWARLASPEAQRMHPSARRGPSWPTFAATAAWKTPKLGR